MNMDALASIVDRTEDANEAWVNGNWADGYGELLSGSDDVSVFGPFGGALAGIAEWKALGPQVVRQFRNGKSKLRVLKVYESGDLFVLVGIEEQESTILDQPGQPWSLRVTQVYRRENDAWKVIHRHVDPLVRERSIQEAIVLAAAE